MGLEAQLKQNGATFNAFETLRSSALTMPAIEVEGARAVETWQLLRDRTDLLEVWPVVVGTRADADALVRTAAGDDRTPAMIVEQSQSVDPEPLAWAKADRDAGLAFIKSTGQDSRWLQEQEPYDPFADATIAPAAKPNDGLQTLAGPDGPHSRVWIGLFPTTSGWEVPAYLRWGGQGSGHDAIRHVSALRHWHETYGATVAAVTPSTLECHIDRPPSTAEQAIELARSLCAYCHDLLERDEPCDVASGLINGRVWSFTWH